MARRDQEIAAEHTDYVSFESYSNAKIMLEGRKRAGPQPDSDKLVNALENIHNLDLGFGATVNFGASEHQAAQEKSQIKSNIAQA